MLKEYSHDVSLQLSPPADHREQELVTLHTELISCKIKDISVKNVEHIMTFGNLLNDRWFEFLSVLGLVHT